MAAGAERIPDRGLLVQAVRLHQAGRLQEAEDAYARYLSAHPDVPTALNNAATLALAMNRAPLAVARLERAVAVDPDGVVGRHNLGFALIRAGRPLDAMFHLERAVARDPGYASAWNNLGIALAHAGNRPEAIRAFERALSLDGGFADAAVNLGDMHNRSGDPARARASFERALAARPDHPGAIVGVSFAQALEGELEPALEAMEQRARPAPRFAPFWQTLGALRHWSGDLDRAEDAYKQASALDPADFDAKFGVASTLLGRGDYPRGLRAFEERPDGRHGPARRFPALPVWGGARVDGTLLVFCEQGLGDVVQFARFVPAARERVGGLAFVVDGYWRPLAPLLASLAGVDHLLKDAVAVEALERAPAARTSVLSLAYLLDVVPDRLPGPIPYLAAPADRVGTWAPRVAALPDSRSASHGRRSIAATTATSPGTSRCRSRRWRRSCPVRRVVCQPAAGRGRRPDAAGRAGGPHRRLDAGVPRFRRHRRDHLVARRRDHDRHCGRPRRRRAGQAGLAARPLQCLLALAARSGAFTWYPTLTIFRQQAFLDWSGPLAAVEAELARVVSGARALP